MNRPLAKTCIGISVSDTADLARLGHLPPLKGDSIAPDLRGVLSDLFRMLIAAGATIQYGGDLRPDGFTHPMMKEAADSYRLSPPEQPDPVFIHILASSVCGVRVKPEQLYEAALANAEQREIRLMNTRGGYRRLTAEIEATETDRRSTVVHLHDGDSVQPIHNVAELEAALASTDETEPDPSRSLAAMRCTMARDEIGRLLLGGPVANYGYNRPTARPGIAQEAYESMRAGKLALPIAAFGGCAHDVAVAMGLLSEPLVTHDELGSNYQETMKSISELAPECLARWEADHGITKDQLEQLAREDVPDAIARQALRLFVASARSV